KKASLYEPNRITVKYSTNSFVYQVSKLWNSIENNVKTLEFKAFKRKRYSWIPNNCYCSVCMLCKLQNI
ncbi:hypothetical protein LSH36_944g00008, partial [Paralvinella palmiformis]